MVEICNGSKSVIFRPKYQVQRCSYLTGHNSKKCTATYDFFCRFGERALVPIEWDQLEKS